MATVKKNEKGSEENVFMFIPDLNGYTKYMSETDSEQSHIIIEKLLRNIVETNHLDMEVSDIFGDAIFFYRVGDPPSFPSLVQQCIDMILSLQKVLKDCSDEYHWIEALKLQSQGLSVKFIAHYGKVRITDIDSHVQLIGKSSIEVNLLLKNSVDLNNYMLISKACFDASPNKEDLIVIGEDGTDTYKHIGRLRYRVFSLDDFMNVLEGQKDDREETDDT